MKQYVFPVQLVLYVISTRIIFFSKPEFEMIGLYSMKVWQFLSLAMSTWHRGDPAELVQGD